MRLFVIVNAALDAGLKAAQAIHAFRSFCGEYPHIEQYWHHESNNIVVLQDDDIPSLAERLEKKGFRLSRFTEPDRDDELTAICAEPGAWKQLSNLPLAS
jgi:hypothetical protein